MALNVVALVGRVGRQPELRYSPTGTAVCNFSLAVSRERKSEEGERETDWFKVVAFGQTAEFTAEYLDKGAQISVTGRLQVRLWDDKDGNRRHSVEVVAERVNALETKAGAERRRAEATA